LHVLVEKPMALRAEDAWDLVERAQQSGRHLMVGYTLQFTRAARCLRDLLGRGALGDLLSVSGLFTSVVQSLFSGRPEEYGDAFGMLTPDAQTYANPQIAGGGQAVTQLTHAVGLLLYVSDLPPSSVMAFMGKAGLAVDLVDAVGFELVGGAVGTLASAGCVQPGQEATQELRYFGSAGQAVHDLVAGRLTVMHNDGSRETYGPGDGEPAYPAHAPARAFVDLIAGRGPNLAPPVPAARAVEFVAACYRSAERRQPVETSGR
jgi:predicted dehydrogenase